MRKTTPSLRGPNALFQSLDFFEKCLCVSVVGNPTHNPCQWICWIEIVAGIEIVHFLLSGIKIFPPSP